MKLVILESPYAGNIERNTLYARACVTHSLKLGESPIASHLLYTQPGILDDRMESERELGIRAGELWRTVADYTVFYIDFGWSSGMMRARSQLGVQIVRHLPGGFWPKPLIDLCGGKVPVYSEEY